MTKQTDLIALAALCATLWVSFVWFALLGAG